LLEKNGVAIVEQGLAIGFFSTSAARSSACSTVPKRLMISTEPLSRCRARQGYCRWHRPEGHDVDDALGRDAENFFDLGGVADQIIFRRIENLNVVVDELHHVLVAGDDIDAIGRGCGFAGESADHVSASKPASSRIGMR